MIWQLVMTVLVTAISLFPLCVFQPDDLMETMMIWL
jgi:hypothetical protein